MSTRMTSISKIFKPYRTGKETRGSWLRTPDSRVGPKLCLLPESQIDHPDYALTLRTQRTGQRRQRCWSTATLITREALPWFPTGERA